MNTTTVNRWILQSAENADESIANESTYAMLVHAEERERTALENVLYFLVVVSAIAAIWQFAQQPIELPLDSVTTVADAAAVSTQSTVCANDIRG
jgi:hypothetical protein